MQSPQSVSTGIRHIFRRLFLASAAFSLSAVCVAQNTDPIGQFLQHQETGYRINQIDTSWSPKISDPIGDLINQAKNDRSLRDSSLGLRAPKSIGQDFVQAALNYVGVRYRFGGAAPNTGFDCSGLIYYTANKYMGVELPRISSNLAQIGESVDRGNLRPGDLVFFNTRGFRNSHVGIYVGNNEFLHSPRKGKHVRVEQISNYWEKRYNGARRIDNNLSTNH